MGRGSRAARLKAAAGFVTAVELRTGPIAKVLREAAPADAEIAQMLRELHERQRRDVAAGMELVMGRRPTDTERDGMWAVLSHEVGHLLLEELGWTAQQYETWIEETLARLIPRS